MCSSSVTASYRCQKIREASRISCVRTRTEITPRIFNQHVWGWEMVISQSVIVFLSTTIHCNLSAGVKYMGHGQVKKLMFIA